MAGNRERGSIAARVPLLRAPQFDSLHFEADEQARWLAAGGAHAERLARQLPQGVAAVGAVARIDGRSLLLVSFDLQCCGETPDSWEAEKREREAALIRDAINQSHAEGVERVLLAGDANNVQGDAPLRQLAHGTPALREVAAARDDGQRWTWDGRGTPYRSARLDHMWHGPGIQVLQARILDVEDWDADRLAAHRVQSTWSREQSPHRPIVADLRILEPRRDP